MTIRRGVGAAVAALAVIGGLAGCGAAQVQDAAADVRGKANDARDAVDTVAATAQVANKLREVDPALVTDPQALVASTRQACAAIKSPQGRTTVKIVRLYYGTQGVYIPDVIAKEIGRMLDGQVCARVS